MTMIKLRVHLRTPGWSVQSNLSVADEFAPIDAWTPLLQGLASYGAQAADVAAQAEGKRVSCAKGCAACCRQLVVISLVEARALAQLVADTPQPRQNQIRARFAAAFARLSENGLLGPGAAEVQDDAQAPLAQTDHHRLAAAWFRLGVACPFLEDEACSIHESRPLVCREYQVTSPPITCSKLYQEPVARIEMPVRIGQALAHATAKICGVSVAMVPLVTALQIPPAVDAALAEPRDPIAVLEAILAEIGDWRVDRVSDDSEDATPTPD